MMSPMPETITIPGQQLRFADLLLNPSVVPEDEDRLCAQAQAVLNLFAQARRLGTDVSTAQLAEIGCQYNARLYECRRYLVRKGFCIDLVRRGDHGVNFYRMVPIEKSEFHRKHREKLEAGGPWR